MTTAEDVLTRFHHLRGVREALHEQAMRRLSPATVAEHARHLGLLRRGAELEEQPFEVMLAVDLALYTAKEGRSRAIDRLARGTHPPPDSDEARMLAALLGARFSIWAIERAHEETGFVVKDMLRQEECWLIDEGIQEAGGPGLAFAGRVIRPEGEAFAMTTGLFVPLPRESVELLTQDSMAWRRGDPDLVAEDPRFATAVYRATLDLGVFEGLHATDEDAR